jgi:hypothetical protein
MQSLILRRPEQENIHKLRQFIGIVNYYHDIWFRRSRLLVRLHWLASHQARSSFKGTHPINRPLKKLKSRKSLELRYVSVIQTSISPFSFIFILMHQIISWGQSSCMIKAYSLVFAKAQYSSKAVYNHLERQRAIINYLKLKWIQEYPVKVPSTHHSLYRPWKFNGLKASDRILRWLLLLEEYGVTFEYLPWKKNVVADALSRFDIVSLKFQEEYLKKC